MKEIAYVGIEGKAITINKPTDIYPLLYWCQSKMIENQQKERTEFNKNKWEKSIMFLSKLMDETEEKGFGNMEDVENIDFS